MQLPAKLLVQSGDILIDILSCGIQNSCMSSLFIVIEMKGNESILLCWRVEEEEVWMSGVLAQAWRRLVTGDLFDKKAQAPAAWPTPCPLFYTCNWILSSAAPTAAFIQSSPRNKTREEAKDKRREEQSRPAASLLSLCPGAYMRKYQQFLRLKIPFWGQIKFCYISVLTSTHFVLFKNPDYK